MPRILTVLTISLILLTGCSATGDDRASELELADTPLPGKFVWHDLITDDPAQSRRFYGALFGWSFQQASRPGGGDYVVVVNGGRYIGGMVPVEDPADEDYSRWLGYISVADVDDAVEAVTDAGGQSVVGPRDIGNIGRAAAVQDPQGAVVGFVRSAVGDPADSATRMGDVAWNELVAANDAAAAGFYQRLLGYHAEIDPRPDGKYFKLKRDGANRAGVMQRPDERIQPLWLTYFGVNDVSGSSQRVRELGGEVLIAPSAEIRNGSIAIVQAPDGAVFGLQQVQ